MSSYIWKPSTVNSWKKGPVFLAPSNTDRSQAPVITVNGQTYTGKYINTNEGRHQWVFPAELAQMQGLQVSYGGQTGAIQSGGQSFEGGDLGGWQARAKGSLGDMSGGAYGGGAYGGNPMFAPGTIGYGAYPAYLGGMFPDPSLVKTAPYNFTDPQKFAEKYGQFNREEYRKNFDLAKQFSTETLDAELQNLQSYVPAASALKRQETAIDNVFNQAQRTAQIDQALPGVRKTLMGQGERAQAYAEGRLPDSMQDRALELGVRSQAADMASVGGFGARSSVARKSSDLMSAQQRLQLGQYGEQLIGSNVQTRANLELAPTSYSDAGAQVRVNPTVSPAQLMSQQLSDINQYSMISPTNALQSNIQQEQFTTGLEQQSRMTNVGYENQFKLGKFNYDVVYASGVAGAMQTDINTQVGFQQQAAAQQYAEANKAQTQRANEISSGIAAVGAVVGAGAGLINSIFGGGSGGGGTAPGTTDSSGGVKQSDGTVQYPDGSSISPDGIIRDAGGDVVGVFDESGGFTPDSSYIPTAGPTEDIPLDDFRTSDDIISEGPTPPSQYEDTTDYGVTPTSDYGDPGLRDDFTINTYSAVKTASAKALQSLGALGKEGEIRAEGDEAAPAPSSGGKKPLPGKKGAGSIGGADINPRSAEARSFVSDVGLNFDAAKHLAQVAPEKIDGAARGVLENAGLSTKPLRGYEPVGVNYKGENVYADSALRRDSTFEQGIGAVQQVQDVLAPFNIKELNVQKFDQIKSVASSPAVISKLDTLAAAGDAKGFVDAVQQAFGKPTTDSPKVKGALSTAMSAYKVMQNWDRMSNAQKGLALSSIGFQSIKAVGGKNFLEIPINKTRIDGQSAMKVKDALSVVNLGANVYETAMNWGDLNNLQKIQGGARTAAALVKAGMASGLIAKDSAAAQSLPYINMATSAMNIMGNWNTMSNTERLVATGTLANMGAAVMQGKELFPGAGAALSAYNVSQNWDKMGTEQRAVAATAIGQAAATAAGYAIPGLNVALAAYSAYQMGKVGYEDYYKGGTSGQKKGYIAAGVLGGPAALAGLGAISMVHSLTKSGKSGDQRARDAVRADWQAKGLVDNDFSITLADGTKANIGVDGKGGMHEPRNPGQLVTTGEMHAYDIDYTNDIDYASGMAGTTLQRLLYGGREETLDKMGGQLGNAFLSSVGYGQDMTEGNFNKVMANARSVYARAGIKSKEDGYQLVGAAAQQGRLTAADQAAAMQTLNMMFDADGYDFASTLMKGRQVNTKNMSDAPPRTSTVTGASPKKVTPEVISKVEEDTKVAEEDTPSGQVPITSQPINRFQGPKVSRLQLSKEDARANNKKRYIEKLVA